MLNVYSEQPGAFGPESRNLGLIFAAHSSVAWNSARRDEQFRRALSSRDTIGQAKGMIMGRYGVDAVQAFELLRKLSQDSHVPLTQIATELVAKAQPTSQWVAQRPCRCLLATSFPSGRDAHRGVPFR